ncbi:Sialic acid TRAP transporter permease protein SiaT [Pseudoruegeria aquimaris]|uniref:Sialic acid TRAP transporter permease protein SiaT n=1 Tax=Pseudoruegeria aquimaris TaxID=393663 RepID=A0A1Y5T6W7_9RHOB|nr:TRAP transporter large permease subunit [Pseudoruegeria aquimaris]SLN53900.1 Sialic acid TRAP transporter permease protein SiaT [Pseudoruegeria aquimaris]
MDIGTISLVLMLGLILLLAIGMPLGMASAFLAVLVLVMKFEPALLFNPLSFGDGILTGRPGSGPLNILSQKIYGLLTDYVLISIPLFIFMAALLERSGIAKDMYNSLSIWLNRTRGGIAIVTSIMAVIMAAMSGIIGGEVVLLGLIALPQMLRLGYDQNLAIGTICASGSLGTMIPPSIVLIIYGLITETSIKSLFTAAFVPGFMLASFIIIYIVIRTKIRPDHAPLPNERIAAELAALGPEQTRERAALEAEMAEFEAQPAGREKLALFLSFLCVLAAGFCTILFLRAGFFTITGQNVDLGDGQETIFWGRPDHVLWFAGIVAAALALIFFVFGLERTQRGWLIGKGLVAPIVVIGVVMGSIYGGITGITEAAGMGALSVYILMTLYQKSFTGWLDVLRRNAVWIGLYIGLALVLPQFLTSWESLGQVQTVATIAVLLLCTLRLPVVVDGLWDSLMRTLKSTGTIIWVTIGAAALAGAYTIAGGPTYVADFIVGADLPTMGILLMMMLILLFMGAFMDWVGIVLLIIPVFLPIVQRLPIEEIGLIGTLQPKYLAVWFGVLFCMNMQVSFLSPPFGPAAFYLKSVAPPHISLTDIFKGFLPFIGIQILALSVLLIWPPIIEILLK